MRIVHTGAYSGMPGLAGGGAVADCAPGIAPADQMNPGGRDHGGGSGVIGVCLCVCVCVCVCMREEV